MWASKGWWIPTISCFLSCDLNLIYSMNATNQDTTINRVLIYMHIIVKKNIPHPSNITIMYGYLNNIYNFSILWSPKIFWIFYCCIFYQYEKDTWSEKLTVELEKRISGKTLTSDICKQSSCKVLNPAFYNDFFYI